MSAEFDIAVIGSGYAGSLMAMVARRLGRSVVMVERGTHPRVVIGESSTPLSNLLLEELADRYDLPRIKPLAKWGSWQAAYRELACGLKRGFSFFHADGRRMLVEASPGDEIADTHWFRADTDAFLVREACTLGVTYIDECVLQAPVRESDNWRLKGERCGAVVELRAKLLLDATGPRGFLHTALELGESVLPGCPETSVLYSHFSRVHEIGAGAGAPFPPDAAALHHVFEGGWMWVLRFNNGWTSAGFAVTAAAAERFGFAEGEAGWHRALQALPTVGKQFAEAQVERPFTYAQQVSFRSAQMTGPGWALLPSAAGFVDPLFSTGFPLNLLGIAQLADVLRQHWGSPLLESGLREYAVQTDGNLLATGRLIAALYANMSDFSAFQTLSLLYFAAASYSETVRRLGKPERARGFLLWDDPVFGPESWAILERALAGDVNEERVYRLIEDFDVAGLGKRPESGCYPVRAEDVYAGAHLMGAKRAEIDAMLERAGFAPA